MAPREAENIDHTQDIIAHLSENNIVIYSAYIYIYM
jgi:hypothetical protein